MQRIIITFLKQTKHFTALLFEPNIYVSLSTSELRLRLVTLNTFKHSSMFTERFIVVYVSCLSLLCCLVCPCNLMITCWEKANHLALWCVVFTYVFCLWCRGAGVIVGCVNSLFCFPLYFDNHRPIISLKLLQNTKWRKMSKIRIWYKQVPPLPQDIIWESGNNTRKSIQ